ncbi:MAG: 30S ribosomal protein S3 [Proteobacteria bacterium]|nr:30S ribosomal protein S3 [Pseudomonadota bacterium]
MGQKVNPIGLRLGITKTWQSNWYAEKRYSDILLEDIRIKKYITKNLRHAGIASVEIERAAKNLKVYISAMRPGIIIGRKGEEAEKVKKAIAKIVNHQDLVVNIKEVRRPEIDAQLIANNIAMQLERRVAFRRVMKKTLQNVMRFNVTGCKIMIAGRLNGAEMARTEWVLEGRIPLHTLKADIDYAVCKSKTVYGVLGVKVWVYNMQKQVATQGRRRRRKFKREK